MAPKTLALEFIRPGPLFIGYDHKMSRGSQMALEAPMKLDPDRIRTDFPILDQAIYRARPLIYLDNAASTQRPRQVLEAMNLLYERFYSNVHRGNHWLSEQSTEQFDLARESVARFLNAELAREVVFTSGTTAGINLVAQAWGNHHVSAGDEILLTEMEHHSNIVPWQMLAERVRAKVRFAPIDGMGRLDLDAVDSMLGDRTRVFAFAAISNVLGTINPVAKLVEMARSRGVLTVVDAAQYVPHEPTDLRLWGADFVAFSGHKMLGPTGIGVLHGRFELLEKMPPFLGGGGMIDQVTLAGFTPGEAPGRFEAGTPPVAEAIGLRAAIDYLSGVGMEAIRIHEKLLTEHALNRISHELNHVRVFGPLESRAGIISFVVDGVHPMDLAKQLDLEGIAIRFGHHCAMPLHERLGVRASCRASFYLYNTIAEVDRFVDVLRETILKLRV